jgi:hypothetical protein
MIDSANDFIKFMRSSNNIAYRNVTFEDVLLDGWAEIPFIFQGFPGRLNRYDLVIDGSELPEGSKVEIKMQRRLLRKRGVRLRDIGKLKSNLFKFSRLFCREVVLRIFKGNKAVIRNLRITAKMMPKCILRLHLSQKAKPGHEYPVRLIQKTGPGELGRITVLLRAMRRE